MLDFRGADLRGRDLREQDFRGADLRGADLRDAWLHRADFRGACTYGVRVDSRKELKYLAGSLLGDGAMCDTCEHRSICRET